MICKYINEHSPCSIALLLETHSNYLIKFVNFKKIFDNKRSLRMFLQKCFKASSVLCRTFRTNRWFSVVKIDDNSTLTIPYNFSGVNAPKDASAQYSRIFANALELIYESNPVDGFKFAFKSTMEAIVQKDLEYFKSILEPKLYYEMEKGILNIEELKLLLDEENFDNEKVKVVVTGMSLVYGVHHDRNKNYTEEDYRIRKYSTNPIRIEIRQLIKENEEYYKNLFPMIRVECTFYSARNILLTKANGEVIEGADSSGFHSIVFESTGDPDDSEGAKNVDKILQDSTGFFGMFRLAWKLRNMKKLIKELFPADDVRWKIVDIDGHLKGNPYTK